MLYSGIQRMPSVTKPLMEPHAIRHGGAGVEFIVSNPAHQLDHALAFLEVVDDGRGRHTQDV